MPIIAKDSPRKEYPTCPEGLHQGVCCDVVDVGLVKGQYGEKYKVELRWFVEVEDVSYMVLRRYTLSLNEKATLRGHLEAWRGKKFTAEELEGFDLEKLIGVNGQIQVVHSKGDDGRVWANVSAVVPLGKGMTKMRASETYVRVKDRDAQPAAAGAGADDDQVPF